MQHNPLYVYKPLVNISAPIIAGKELGGLLLDTPIDQLKEWVIYNTFTKNNDDLSSQMVNNLFCRYTIPNAFHITISLFDGKIEMLSCSVGYEGWFENFFKPGMTWKKLVEKGKTIYPHNGFLYIKDTPGISFDIPEMYCEYDTIEEIPDFAVEEIFISQIGG